MRTITVEFTVPECFEADYSDVVAELVIADFFDGNGFDEAKIISDSAPPGGTPASEAAGTPRAVSAMEKLLKNAYFLLNDVDKFGADDSGRRKRISRWLDDAAGGEVRGLKRFIG